MNHENSAAPSSEDWAQERGRKWAEHLQPTEAMLAPVDLPLVAALKLDGSHSVADIGCGGGFTTRSIAQSMPANAVVHGYDISPELIALAESVADDKRLRFFCEDTQTATPYSEGQAEGDARGIAGGYDRLSSRFGVMFFPDPFQAFRNLHQWLRPGGRFAFAVWGPPPENPWMMVLRRAVADVVDLPSPEPDAPGPFRYENGESFVRLLSECGFGSVEFDRWQQDLALGGGLSAGDAARFALSAFGIGEQVAHDPDLAARAFDQLSTALAPYEQEGRVLMQGTVNIVTGERQAP
ncbi:MAG: class I SAM-dependent methyltransferase [Pseudomonadota bacterium]